MPQPIDTNTEIMRLTTAERVQQALDRTSLAAQSRTATEADEARVNIETQVREMNQKSAQVDRDLARRNPYLGRRRRRKGQQDDDARHTTYTPQDGEAEDEEAEIQHLDVSV